MKKLIVISTFFILALAAVALQRNIEGLKEEAEHAAGGRQAKLCSELAEQLVGIADQQFTQGSSEQAQATVQDVLKYAQLARDAAVRSRDNMKQTEIRLRQTQRHLEAVRRTLPVDDRAPLDAVEKKVEQFRSDLLEAMFSPRKKEKT
ncbi:MAG TPA: hypothetical protein VKY85_03620 [Candidatus Angelobacter sp.]|nr:hypothetical protein [Candidatus Angelobacter sp.]